MNGTTVPWAASCQVSRRPSPVWDASARPVRTSAAPRDSSASSTRAASARTPSATARLAAPTPWGVSGSRRAATARASAGSISAAVKAVHRRTLEGLAPTASATRRVGSAAPARIAVACATTSGWNCHRGYAPAGYVVKLTRQCAHRHRSRVCASRRGRAPGAGITVTVTSRRPLRQLRD